MNFKEKVQSMTAKEIILAMVDSLTHPPIINIDMNTYGENRQGVCFGCAATNTICKISGVVFTPENIGSRRLRSKAINNNIFDDKIGEFLYCFERAIDALRGSELDIYNIYADHIKFALIVNPLDIKLRHLDNDYTNDDLKPYIELANSQP